MDCSADHALPLHYPFPLGPYGTPPPVLTWAREHRPVCPVILPSGDRVWMITRKDDITRVFTDRRFSRDLTYPGAPRFVGDDFTIVPGGIFNLDPPDHTRIRHALNPFYTPARVQRYRPMIERHAGALLEAMASSPGPADLLEVYAAPLPLRVSCELLDIPIQHRVQYLEAFRTQIALNVDADQVSAATSTTLEFTDQVIAAKRARPSADDPVGALIRAHRDGAISEQELRGTVSYLFVTGSDPLVSPVATGVITLLRHREQLDQCIADPRLWPKAVEELLRYHHNGVLGYPRVATEDVTLHGVRIVKGDGVCAPMLGATWDERHYPAPDEFDIHRPTDATATFGAGPHFCLGAAFSRLYLAIAFQTLFDRFPELRLSVHEDDIPWRNDVGQTRPDQVPVCW
ncbi:cytochrome P450 [Spirillospora sp. CA-108201]